MPRRWLLGPLLIFAVTLLTVVLLLGRGAPGSTQAARVGAAAPNFELHDVRGKTLSLDGLRGRPVLVNFWATWCIPCRTEMPLIDRFWRQNPRVAVLAVDVQEPAADVKSFIHATHIGFSPLLDSHGSVAQLYGVGPKPESLWIDTAGVIRSMHYGPMTLADMRRALATAER